MFHLTIITAEGQLYSGEIEMLVARAIDGEIGILTNHHPLVTKLGPGAMRVVRADKSEQLLFVNGGFLEVINNKATVLADVAENMEAIEVEQARAARLKAQELVAKARSSNAVDEMEMAKLEEELRAQMVRERLAEVNKFQKKR